VLINGPKGDDKSDFYTTIDRGSHWHFLAAFS